MQDRRRGSGSNATPPARHATPRLRGSTSPRHVERIRFEDCDQLSELVPTTANRYTQLDPGGSAGSITRLDLGGLLLMRIAMGSRTLCQASGAPGLQYTVVPLRWRGDLRFDGERVEQPSLLAWGHDPGYVRRGRDVELCVLVHNQEEFLSAAETWTGRSPEAWADMAGASVALRQGGGRFHVLLSSVLRAMEGQPELFECSALRASVARSLTTAMFDAAAAGGIQSVTPTRSRIGCNRIVRRCEDYLRAHPPGRVTKLDLCRVAGVSARCLQTAFREVCDVSPIEYLRLRRLREARRLLRSGDPEHTSVKACALQAGFLQLGRFSVEYRRQFGERPSETLRGQRRRG